MKKSTTRNPRYLSAAPPCYAAQAQLQNLRTPSLQSPIAINPGAVPALPSTRNCVPEMMTLSPFLQSRDNGVIVADWVTEGYRPLVARHISVSVLSDVNECLAAKPSNCQYWHYRHRADSPDNACFDQLRCSNLACSDRTGAFARMP